MPKRKIKCLCRGRQDGSSCSAEEGAHAEECNQDAEDGIGAEERSKKRQSPRNATQPRKAGAEEGAVAKESNQVAEESNQDAEESIRAEERSHRTVQSPRKAT